MELKYSDYAIVLNWNVINNEPDIGNWKMLFEKDNSELNGNGMSELLETLLQLNQEQINVIYVKNLNLFEVIGENYFSYSSDFMGVIKDKQIKFFNLKLFDWVQLVSWDSFWDEIEDCKEFLRRLNLCRENLKGNNKTKLSLKSHYRITKAADQWFDIKEKYYLNSPWANDFRFNLLPQDEEELDLFINVNKASYYFTNPKFINKITENVYGYDISSSHSGFMIRKKYPASSSKQPTSRTEINEVIERKFFAWIGEFEFIGLRRKVDLPIDLRKFGVFNCNDNWQLILTNAHWDTFNRIFEYDEIIPLSFKYYLNKELNKNYAVMLNNLYSEKEQAKQNEEDDFIISTRKFRTELPFGQSIKMPIIYQAVIYNEETNEFEKLKLDKEPFDDIINRIKRNSLPMQIGIWTAAYSWSEEINMILDIGIENVVYGDTDCVKFIGEEGIGIIESHNREIDQEFKKINNKRIMLETSNKIGRWQSEGIFTQFKAIGVKWYLFNGGKGLEVKCAGGNKNALLNWLNQQKNPFEEFNKEMCVPGLFKNISINRIKKTVYIGYNNYMGDNLKNEIALATNGFVI